MAIQIPQRLWSRIQSDSEQHANVLKLIQNTQTLFVDRPEFFPDYTIHGIQHIETVLDHANHLIPDTVLDIMQPKDISFLVGAIILHDLGMFAAKAGVRKLLLEDRRTYRTDYLDKLSWEEEWASYLEQIKRYSEEKFLYHFGIGTRIIPPDVTNDNLSDVDKIIIGEFLRRHHHRLAHEIAVCSMPGAPDQDVFADTAYSVRDRMAIGILARSHGMSIRETENYINRRLGRGYAVPLYYLMSVLRIADYLDAGKGRAPEPRQHLQGIHIPVSVNEWTWNQKIIEGDSYWDPDHIRRYIFADPTSTRDFVQIEKWLKTVQNELDLCWSVIVEMYGSEKYRLSIHRIDSNILEDHVREEYSNHFLIKEAKLSANPELLKLLIAPLYGDDPSYGVREMLQNAVDACNERRDQEGERYTGSIRIDVDTAAKVFTISDDGIGMDENILLNYYLAAGASYRNSDEWIRDYARNGMPNFERSGRFGVGVLASFLLGSTIRVQTRHLKDQLGYKFQFDLKPVPLNVERIHCLVGTTIQVDLSDKAFAALQNGWNNDTGWTKWFRFNRPRVQYYIDGTPLQPNMSYIPSKGQRKVNWFHLEDTGYEMFQWGYPESGFFCNGIRIPDGMPLEYPIADMAIPAPCVSLIDRTGKLPLDLSRRTLLNFPKGEHLRKSVFEYVAAELLMTDWSGDAFRANIENGVKLCRRNSINQEAIPFVCSKDHFSILSSSVCFRSTSSVNTRVLIIGKPRSVDMDSFVRSIPEVASPVPVVIAPMEFDDSDPGTSLRELFFWVLKATAKYGEGMLRKVWLNRNIFPYPAKDILGYDVTPIWLSPDHNLSDRLVASRQIPFGFENWRKCGCPVVIDAVLPDQRIRSLRSFDLLIDQLLEHDPWIPYDMEKRRRKYPKAFQQLKRYIDRIEQNRKK